MSRHPAGTLNIGGARFDTEVDDDGQWYAYLDGNSMYAPTKEDLRKKLVRATKAKRAQVAVEFTKVTSYSQSHNRGRRAPKIETRDGTATGMHSSNGNVLVRWADGETEQYSYWYDHLAVTRLTPEEAERWQQLYIAARDAEISLNAFLAEHELDLTKATRAAIDATVAGDDDDG